MSSEEFVGYRLKVIEDYAAQSARAGRFEEEISVEEAERAVSEILPDGLKTRDHFIYVAEVGGENVGSVWISHRRSESMIWIYDIEVSEALRRRGFGLEILRAVEEKARDMSVERVGLHVFGHNSGAIRLYERAGYETTSLVMTRVIES